jgi:DNA-binding transcriptional LysR family regulator
LPSEALSLKRVLDRAWSRNLGGQPRGVAEASSIDMIKALALRGIGIGWLTSISALREIETGSLIFVPLEDQNVDLFVFHRQRVRPYPLILPR